MKKWHVWLLAIVTTIVLLIGTFSLYVFFTVKDYENSFFPDTFIEDQDLSKLTEAKAKEVLADITNDYDQTNVTITTGDKTYTKTLKDIGVQYDTAEKLEEAFQYGKSENAVKQFFLIKKPKENQHTLSYSIDEAKLEDWLTTIEQEMKVAPKNATISIRNGQVNVIDDQKGTEIDKLNLKLDLLTALQKNAKKDIQVSANLKEIEAPLTKETLSQVKRKIGSFSTHFVANNQNRNLNIKLATETIDSYLLLPGESFSFNDYVGDTTASKGYKSAPSFLNGKVVESYGGGVCQVSTTLYNALIKAGIIPDNRYNHSMTVSYVPIGQDAAIAYGYKDLTFTNPYNSPIYIEGTVSATSVTFSIYSTENSKPANTDYQLKSAIVAQNEKGITSVTYLETVTNGKVSERKQIYKDWYKNKQ